MQDFKENKKGWLAGGIIWLAQRWPGGLALGLALATLVPLIIILTRGKC